LFAKLRLGVEEAELPGRLGLGGDSLGVPVVSGSVESGSGVGIAREGGEFSSLLLLTFELLRVAPEERVDHDIPGVARLDLALEEEDLTSKEPIEESDGFLALVVSRDGEVDKLERRVSVSESETRNIGESSLLNSLEISARISDNKETRLHKASSDLVGKSARSPTRSKRLSTNILGELGNSTRTIRTLRDDHDVRGILNSGNDTSSNLKLLPSLAEINKMNTIGSTLKDIALHAEVNVTSTQMSLADNHTVNVLLLLLSERLIADFSHDRFSYWASDFFPIPQHFDLNR
jgi:hypothetical protein